MVTVDPVTVFVSRDKSGAVGMLGIQALMIRDAHDIVPVAAIGFEHLFDRIIALGFLFLMGMEIGFPPTGRIGPCIRIVNGIPAERTAGLKITDRHRNVTQHAQHQHGDDYNQNVFPE